MSEDIEPGRADGGSPEPDGGTRDADRATVWLPSRGSRVPDAADGVAAGVPPRVPDAADGVAAGVPPRALGAAGVPSRAPDAAAVEARERTRKPSHRDRMPWLVAVAVFGAYTVISLYRYLRLDPASWDLGIFTEYVKQFAHLRAPVVDIRAPGLNLLGDHFHPIVALIAPLFAVFPTPVTLLVAQAALVAVSVIPVSAVAADKLGVAAGRAIGTAYGFCWVLQELVDYDFHELAFAVPLLALSLSALVRGRAKAAALWAMPLVFVKEDQGFTVAVIGLIIAFAYQRRISGILLACWGLAWSDLAIGVIIPYFNPQHHYPYWSSGGPISPVGGHFSLGGLWAQLGAGGSTKLTTLALLLAPTLFLALGSPLVLAAVPNLALRFVGTTPAFWGTEWHYNAPLAPILFIAAIDALARLKARRAAGLPARVAVVVAAVERYAATAMLAVCVLLAFHYPLAQLWQPGTYRLGPQVAAANAAMAKVPDGAKVATDLQLLAPLAARTDTYWLGNFGSNPPTAYVVFDTWSTDWQPPPRNVLAFVEQITHGTRYRQVFQRDGFYVFRRIG